MLVQKFFVVIVAFSFFYYNKGIDKEYRYQPTMVFDILT